MHQRQEGDKGRIEEEVDMSLSDRGKGYWFWLWLSDYMLKDQFHQMCQVSFVICSDRGGLILANQRMRERTVRDGEGKSSGISRFIKHWL